jgi:hypothetical protein
VIFPAIHAHTRQGVARDVDRLVAQSIAPTATATTPIARPSASVRTALPAAALLALALAADDELEPLFVALAVLLALPEPLAPALVLELEDDDEPEPAPERE